MRFCTVVFFCITLSVFGAVSAQTTTQTNQTTGSTNTNNTNVNVVTPNQVLDINAQTHWDELHSTHTDTPTRGRDYQRAYNRLRELHPHGKIYAIVKGRSIERINKLVTMDEGTLVELSYGPHRRTITVHTHEIEEIGVRHHSHHSPIRVYMPQSTDHQHHHHHRVHDVDDNSIRPYHEYNGEE